MIIALFCLAGAALARETKGFGEKGFPSPTPSSTSCLHVLSHNVSIYCMRLSMAAVEARLEESFSQIF